MKKARFVGGDTFWNMFLAYRTCWFMGRYGGGKTSLAVIMAARLLAEKRINNVFSNIPLSFSTSLDDIGTMTGSEFSDWFKNCALLLDETWIYINDRNAVVDYAAFIRKFNQYLLMPSVFPVHQRLSYFFVQRVFNGYTLGIPAWFYQWNISNRGIKEKGYFAVTNPTAVFGQYPTDYVPGDDGGISKAVTALATIEGFRGKMNGRKNKTSGNEEIEQMEDVTAEIGEYAEDLEKVARAIRRKR